MYLIIYIYINIPQNVGAALVVKADGNVSQEDLEDAVSSSRK